ncbi:MAG: hypothetical protein PWQ73_238 [Petrotoga sp.]|nr:hypothetical protein [Petrotoga sp.]
MSNRETYYALLTYSTFNLGDDIQSLAAKQFLPRIDYYINRDFMDKLSKIKPMGKIKIIMNGWFAHRTIGWPLPDYVDPLFISFHVDPSSKRRFLRKDVVNYLRKFRVGCRDLWTENLLKSYGIDAYFSGCLTLTLDMKYKSQERDDYVLIADISDLVFRNLPDPILRKSIIRTNQINTLPNNNIFGKVYRKIFPESYWSNILKKNQLPINFRLSAAECRLREIARAKLVITSKLHIAMPAVSLGVPVIFIHRNLEDPRFLGLIDFVNAYTENEFLNEINKIDWFSIQNPNREKSEILKQNLKDVVEEFLKSSS